MPDYARGGQRQTIARLISASIVVLALVVTTLEAHAGENEQPIRLTIRPVGIEGTYYDLKMSPGETRQLTVELGNHGGEAISVRTYAADAYSIVNGGFGAKLDGDPVTGITNWLDYPAETFTLEAGMAQIRTFAVTVPQNANPGEYITSIAIQNAEPVSSGGAGIAFNQVIRQVIAVAITVPGPVVPRLDIGIATHSIVAGSSVVSITLRNTGNVHLKPVGEFVLRNSAGAEVSRYAVVMDSFYAGAETKVEIPFDGVLNPGDYSISLSLRDEEHDIDAGLANLALTIPTPGSAADIPVSSQTGKAAINQPQLALPPEAGIPFWIILSVAVGTSIVGTGLIVGLRRRRGTTASISRASKVTTTEQTEPRSHPTQPGHARQIEIPTRSGIRPITVTRFEETSDGGINR